MFNFFGKYKREIERLTKLAYYDSLTNLPNRVMFQEQSSKQMIQNRASGEPLSVFLIDLDNFKHINDTHGHQVGDLLLKQIATRLEAIKHSRCTVADTVGKYKHENCSCIAARLGGDEFVMVFDHMDKHEAEIVALQIVRTLKEPVIVGTNEIIVSASVGVSIFPWDANNTSGLLKAADLAMYAAKDNGKDRFAFHESYMNTKIERRVEAELMVREIINTKKVEMFYQPIFCVKDESIVGFEALLRANKPKGDTFSPMELIRVAEESNLIVPLGSIILEKACSFACECLDIGVDLSVSVNVSSPQLTAPNFKQIVEGILDKTGLPAQNLILEITETILMSNFEQSAITLQQLRLLGIRISIDDFGKGYSSFNYLQALPISKIKIDMSFVQALGDKKANAIVKGIIEMADALGMEACAEGVETKQQLIKLKEFGCERAQGHYKYPALNALQFFEMLNHENVIRF